MYGDVADWGLAEMLLAKTIDVINVGNWQRQAKKGAPRPKPIDIPTLGKKPGEKVFGKGRGFTPAQLDDIFSRDAEHPQEEVTDGG